MTCLEDAEELWLPLVTKTNSFATEQSRSETPSSSKWTPVTMKTNVMFTMAILQLPARTDLNWLCQTTVPKAMLRDKIGRAHV